MSELYKVMTYNDGGNEAIPDRLLEIIREQMPDLLGLQEVVWKHKHLFEAGMPEYDSVFFSIDKTRYGHPIFYRKDKFRLLDCGTQWVSDTPDVPDSRYTESAYIRSYTYAKFMDLETKNMFYYVNTHLDYVDAANKIQVKKFLELTEKFRSLPHFFTADWNMNDTQDGYKYMCEAGYKSTRDDLGEKSYGTMRGSDIDIDFCFIDPKTFKTVSYKVVKNHKFSDSASDHYPVVSEITRI